jgi:hypothetical protein
MQVDNRVGCCSPLKKYQIDTNHFWLVQISRFCIPDSFLGDTCVLIQIAHLSTSENVTVRRSSLRHIFKHPRASQSTRPRQNTLLQRLINIPTTLPHQQGAFQPRNASNLVNTDIITDSLSSPSSIITPIHHHLPTSPSLPHFPPGNLNPEIQSLTAASALAALLGPLFLFCISPFPAHHQVASKASTKHGR